MKHFSRTVATVVRVLIFVFVVQGTQGYAASDDLFAKIGMSKMGNATAAPDFTLKDLAGNSVSLRDFRGNTVFLNFWATWCQPCRWEMPSMENLYRQLRGKGLVMLAVDLKEDRNQVAGFMNQLQLSFPALLDRDGTVSSQYRVFGLPVTFVIDPRGRITAKHAGAKDWANRDVVQFFNSLLKDSGGEASEVSVSLPTIQIPAKLFPKKNGAALYARQDSLTDIAAKLEQAEELTTLANISSGGQDWYMVKTRKGLIGWVKAADVEQK